LRRHVDTQNEQAQEYAEIVQGSVRRMERLIADLLSYSRMIESGPITQIADLNGSLSEGLAVLKESIQQSGATIVCGSLPKVRGDEQQLAHVFQNLLSNALKYRREDKPPLVEVSATKRDAEWVIGVEDNGIGFENEYAEKIFGLFKRLHRDEYPGTGLGLAICKRIVERCGGTMWADSEVGKGSTFYFALPEA
jgi:signal transduction histidine kinase